MSPLGPKTSNFRFLLLYAKEQTFLTLIYCDSVTVTFVSRVFPVVLEMVAVVRMPFSLLPVVQPA